jgi:hypothetical protein
MIVRGTSAMKCSDDLHRVRCLFDDTSVRVAGRGNPTGGPDPDARDRVSG